MKSKQQKKPDTWMPWYIADYLADTTHLTTEQHGAYMLLLMAAWRKGGTLPNDDNQLASITRLSLPSWRKHKPVLLAFFEIHDGELTQGRLSDELASAMRSYQTKVENGRNGGRPRKQKLNETENKPAGFDSLNLPGNRKGKRTETQPQPQEQLSEPNGPESVLPHPVDRLPEIWQPDRKRLAAELFRAGVPMPADDLLQQTLSRFTLEYQHQFETFPDRWPEDKRYGRLLGWLIEDHRNGKQQKSPGSGATRQPGKQTAGGKSPRELIEAERAAELGDNGSDH